jgi:heme/copper-type cytochrome/quinol oxidase subunit 4
MVDGPPILQLRIATLRVEEDIKHGKRAVLALHPITEEANVQGVLLSPVLATNIHVQVYHLFMNTSSTKRYFVMFHAFLLYIFVIALLWCLYSDYNW